MLIAIGLKIYEITFKETVLLSSQLEENSIVNHLDIKKNVPWTRDLMNLVKALSKCNAKDQLSTGKMI